MGALSTDLEVLNINRISFKIIIITKKNKTIIVNSNNNYYNNNKNTIDKLRIIAMFRWASQA